MQRAGRWQGWADAAALAAVAVLLRAPFASGWLWAWDSVLYARAIDDFHLGASPLEQRPHPPGYALYVFAARALASVFGDERAGLVAFSVIAGALTVACGYALGRSIGGRRTGLAAAAVLLADPVLWQASAIAYPYVTLALLSGAIGIALWRTRSAGTGSVLLASATFGLALGFRQDLALHTGALWAWTLWRRGPRVGSLGVVATVIASLVWLVPTVLAAGGLDRYVALVAGQATYASWLDGVPPAAVAIPRNAGLAAIGLGWQLLWLWPLAVGGALLLLRRQPAAAAYLAVWLAPSALVLLLFHTGEAGYTLALAVPLAVLAGVLVDRALALPSPRLAVGAGVAATVLVALLGASFVVGRGRFSAYAIRRHDRILAAQITYIRSHYAPADTAIVGRANYMHAVWYLPEYAAVYAASRREGGSARALARAVKGKRFAVLFDDSHPRLRQLAERARLGGGIDLYVIRLGAASFAALEDDDDELSVD